MRREFLTSFCARRSLPKGAVSYLAAELLAGGHELRKALESPELLAQLTGVVKTGETLAYGQRDKLPALSEGVTAARAQVLALAVVLAAHEQSTGVHSWRNPPTTTAGSLRGVAGYLQFLETVGYELAPVEKIAAATVSAPGRRTHRRPAASA